MNKRILIVDDEQNIMIPLEYLMRREGFEVEMAADGETAMQLLESYCPDLILLDVMLPKINGFEVCRLIRTDPGLQSVKIIMLSAKGRDTEIAKGLELGADAYLTKPFSTRELALKIRLLLGGTLRGEY
jgi:DNA-binding response OmpR family regulator